MCCHSGCVGESWRYPVDVVDAMVRIYRELNFTLSPWLSLYVLLWLNHSISHLFLRAVYWKLEFDIYGELKVLSPCPEFLVQSPSQFELVFFDGVASLPIDSNSQSPSDSV